MNSTKEDNKALREKIREGLDLTFKKLLKEKREADDVFVFSKDGKIIEIKARDFKEEDGL